ncbi:helix-turn-helix domain-containing protein [Neomoorella thermoacetica]|uniref:helix-turn-helix domain-containing protein n=1 Tax=Neomoorella thermoacetica TaxID=1525 RepID=UPI0008FB8DBD|nr:helix-turn-helix domain-containing protein [Moorella thermoacetica]APC08571.1 HTH-type transcriptional regulator ImmR [Moorella thermoacetica]
MKTLGERLRKLREEKGLTQIELAKKLSLANSTISQYEANKRTPDPPTLQRLADFFGVSIDYLLGRTNTPVIHNKKPDEEATRLFARLSGLTPEGREKVLRELEWIEELERKRFLERKKRQNQEKN